MSRRERTAAVIRPAAAAAPRRTFSTNLGFAFSRRWLRGVPGFRVRVFLGPRVRVSLILVRRCERLSSRIKISYVRFTVSTRVRLVVASAVFLKSFRKRTRTPKAQSSCSRRRVPRASFYKKSLRKELSFLTKFSNERRRSTATRIHINTRSRASSFLWLHTTDRALPPSAAHAFAR
jgi:hypothetical protein